MIEINSADLRSGERGEARAYRVQRGGAQNLIFDVTDDLALDGQVVAFNVPFPYRNDLVMLKPDCFGDISNRRIGFWIEHEEALEAASTDDALELFLDDDGLQFRLSLGQCKLGPVIARMCNVGSRSAMSHGSDVLAERRETIAGHSVRVITRARLKEITLCKQGAAGDNAFAMVVDKTVTAKPVAGNRSALFNAARTLNKVSRQVRQLKASVAATYGERDQRPAVRWSVDASNRSQTANTQYLQEQARLRLD